MKKPSRDRRAEACTRTHWRMRVGTRARGKRIGAQPRCAPLLRSYARQAIEAFERKLISRPVGFAVTDLVTDAASSCRAEGGRREDGSSQRTASAAPPMPAAPGHRRGTAARRRAHGLAAVVLLWAVACPADTQGPETGQA